MEILQTILGAIGAAFILWSLGLGVVTLFKWASGLD